MTIWHRPSAIAVVAPHGGAIEPGTSDIARAVAGDDFNLYLFEGTRRSGNFARLHLTSHRFDEPRCLALIQRCPTVVAIHGFEGDDERVFVGGRDAPLASGLAASLRAAGVPVELEGHQYPGVHPLNVCNRGQSGRGVQLEISRPLRERWNELGFCEAVRAALLALSSPVAEPVLARAVRP